MPIKSNKTGFVHSDDMVLFYRDFYATMNKTSVVNCDDRTVVELFEKDYSVFFRENCIDD